MFPRPAALLLAGCLIAGLSVAGCSSVPQQPGVAVAAALHRLLHETTAAFTARWRAYLRAELGR